MLISCIETVGIIVLALFGAFSGTLFGKRKAPWWLLGYILPLIIVTSIALARLVPKLEFMPFFQRLMAGRMEFAMLGFAVPMLFGALIGKLRRKSERILVWVLVFVAVVISSVLPFLLPVFYRTSLKNIDTIIDPDGVCIQSNSYNCGPASAVTALYSRGVETDEGDLAILAYTTPVTGTASDILCDAINKGFSKDGVHAKYRMFENVEELDGLEPVVAVIRYSLLVDHFITVLDVTDSEVIIGDPLIGKCSLSIEDFYLKWRRTGIRIWK